MKYIYKFYAYIFGFPFFSKFNKFLYLLSLRGIGVLNYNDEYLNGERKWLKDFLKGKTKPVVIDVGANIGNYSKEVFFFNNTSHVYAFEPHPKTHLKLHDNLISIIENGGNLNLYNLGMGSKIGKLELFDYSDQDGSQHASLFKQAITDIHKAQAVSFLVDIITLDKFVDNANIYYIDILKIDTEGNEFNVLLGSLNLIKNNRIRVIQFEFNEMNIVSGVTFKMFWDLLDNFNFYRILPGGKLFPIKNYNPLYCEIYAYQNIIAILKNH